MVRLSFGSANFKAPGRRDEDVTLQLEYREEEAGNPPRQVNAASRFRRLLQALHRQSGQRVAVLVDEYDKPILDALEEPETARANRDYLRGLYGVIKDCDAHVRFTFLTGVSKFSKVNLFSQLNNLITSPLIGATRDLQLHGSDLDTVFASELAGLDREWYHGYRWRGAEKVYNPYDVLLLFDSREFRGHWFETDSPAFLVDKLLERRVSSVSLDETLGTGELLSAFDVEHIGTEALLFQTGYLTITGEERLGGEAPYRLGYPNREVRQSLNRVLLRHLVQDKAQQTANSIRLARLLETHDCAGLKELFHAFFASIPYQRYAARRCRRTNDDIADFEGFMPAWSTPTSRHWATRWRWRSRAATAGWTWRCAPADTCTCSSSRWRRWPRRDPRWHNCRNAATRTSTGPGAIRST